MVRETSEAKTWYKVSPSLVSYWMRYNGIGEKVADCICLYGLGLKEAFPMDTWMKRIVKDYYNGHFPIERYKPFAGVLQQFMFYFERDGGNAHESV